MKGRRSWLAVLAAAAVALLLAVAAGSQTRVAARPAEAEARGDLAPAIEHLQNAYDEEKDISDYEIGELADESPEARRAYAKGVAKDLRKSQTFLAKAAAQLNLLGFPDAGNAYARILAASAMDKKAASAVVVWARENRRRQRDAAAHAFYGALREAIVIKLQALFDLRKAAKPPADLGCQGHPPPYPDKTVVSISCKQEVKEVHLYSRPAASTAKWEVPDKGSSGNCTKTKGAAGAFTCALTAPWTYTTLTILPVLSPGTQIGIAVIAQAGRQRFTVTAPAFR